MQHWNRWIARSMTFRVCAAAAVAAMAGCSDDPEGPEIPPTPVVTGVSPATVSPGDTVTVTGSDFADVFTDNTVKFASSTGKTTPFAGSKSKLSVVVPGNASTGPVSVTVAGASQAGVGPSIVVERSVGEVWVFGGTGTGNPLKLPVPNMNTEYLIIPHATNRSRPFSEIFSYTIDANEATSGTAPAVAKVLLTYSIREEFDWFLRGNEATLLAEAGPRPVLQKSLRAERAAPMFKTFNVLSSLNGNFTQIRAMLRYETPTSLVYADVDTILTGGNLADSDYKNFGDTFENSTRPINTGAFGVESDVDGNGQVIILLTPVVNRLTPPGSAGFIGGFFLSNDLFSPPVVPVGTTNEAEIFYLIVAEPGGELSGNAFPVAFVADGNNATIAHEYEHLISFSHRLFNQGGATQTTWLEEGMAHMAEDLNGFDQANIDRANLYLGDPASITLEHESVPLEQRGGIYLFLRYVTDRFGEGILKDIVQSQCTGRPCIEAATGQGFYETVADFFATLYLSGKGINTSNQYNYQSIDLSNFDPVLVSSAFVGDPSVGGTVMRSAGDFYLFRNTTTTANEFIFTASSNAGLRAVVVQTK